MRRKDWDFGEFIAPDLMATYPRLIRPEWRTLDVLVNAEQTVHKVVRLRNPGARPPLLRCARTTPEEVVITYASPRRLCALARGLRLPARLLVSLREPPVQLRVLGRERGGAPERVNRLVELVHGRVGDAEERQRRAHRAA